MNSQELLVVQGGAGSGKSLVIDILSQQIERILRSPGDNPEHPYCLKAAFTGTAAANIKGQTLHSAFSFSFGNDFFSLSDKKRDERREQLTNLQVVIIDEFSFIKSDMLYLLDLRLREVKEEPDKPFGGVSVFLFGDILQLRPVKAKYIFEEPTNETFQISHAIQSLWQKFRVILLKTNHRQGEDKTYADILNRVRSATFTDEDIEVLKTRVFPANDPLLPTDTLVVTCTNKEVNRINNEKLSLIDEEKYVIDSINKHTTQKEFKPRTDASGAITGTPLQKTLEIKKGAKVMLTHNIDTADCLTNGAFGEVVGFKFDQACQIKEIHVKFYNDDCGRERRKRNIDMQNRYPNENVVSIEKLEFCYSISKNGKTGSATALAYQFPLSLAFASTAHKVQGLTVKKPNSLIVDLRGVRESAQAYVILSRVQSLQQLYIIESLCPEKITACIKALAELDRMIKVAINNNLSVKDTIVSCNIRSIMKNFIDFMLFTTKKNAKVLCLQETWLEPTAANLDLMEDIAWSQENVCFGRGRGLTTFHKQEFQWKANVKCEGFQLTLIESSELNLINVYRSSNAETSSFLSHLGSLLDTSKQTVILGDFNLCYLSQRNHPIFKFLESIDFHQMVENPTHIEGRLIDLVFLNDGNLKVDIRQIAQYFTDHDLLEIR